MPDEGYESYWQTLHRIDDALTGDERTRIVELFTKRNPGYRGANFDDVLEMLYDSDAYCSQVDPILEAHPGGWPIGMIYAAYAVCAQGAELTEEALRDLLRRAGLMEGKDG